MNADDVIWSDTINITPVLRKSLRISGPTLTTISSNAVLTAIPSALPDDVFYRWDFGDATQLDTSATSVTHTYWSPAKYLVSCEARSIEDSSLIVFDTTELLVEKQFESVDKLLLQSFGRVEVRFYARQRIMTREYRPFYRDFFGSSRPVQRWVDTGSYFESFYKKGDSVGSEDNQERLVTSIDYQDGVLKSVTLLDYNKYQKHEHESRFSQAYVRLEANSLYPTTISADSAVFVRAGRDLRQNVNFEYSSSDYLEWNPAFGHHYWLEEIEWDEGPIPMIQVVFLK